MYRFTISIFTVKQNSTSGTCIIHLSAVRNDSSVSAVVYRWMVACIHGDKSQQERDIVLRGESCEQVMISWNL